MARILKAHHPDYVITALIFILVVFGLVMLASASSELGKAHFNDTYYYLKHQALYGLSLGLMAFFAALKIPYRFYMKLAVPLIAASLALLVLVFTEFRHVAGGAGRWLTIGPITFQPAEILKLTLIIYLAAWFSNPKREREKRFFEGFVPFLIIIGLVAGLLIMQPATSTVAILVIAGFTIYFLSGARIKYLLIGGAVGIAALAVIVYATPYRLERVLTYINGDKDPQGAGYHLSEAKIAIGSGGLLGEGYGKSTSKISRLPAVVNDSIFAVIAAELGFVGAGALIVLFGFLTFRIFWLAKNFRDRFGQFLLIGFGTIIGLQAFVNMAAISGVIPLTGVPLPFVSYGGTALAVFLAMGGIIANISKYS